MNSFPSNSDQESGMQPPENTRVLILDDFSCVRSLYGKVLSQMGIASFQTGSESEAWKMLGYPEVRLFIQDFTREPGTLGGLNFYERMRDCPTRCHIPVIIISGTGRKRITEAFFETFEMPLDELVTLRDKPFELSEFYDLLSAYRPLLDLPPWPTN